MLIRQGGQESGIKEYLENGREGYPRDEYDQRVTLYGDLGETDRVIQTIEADKERFLHYTLSFKEDNISIETMRSIVSEFKEYICAAHGSDEYNFYAEAHLPKIQKGLDQATGKEVDRKPHIHIVVPKYNCLSGGYLNPAGLYEQNIKYLEAFQEHINNKYGLASPKDNLRFGFESQASAISRYKGDHFDGKNVEVRSAIFQQVIERNVSTWADFKSLVAEYGELRVRNEGRENEYLNVKAPGWDRGANLSDRPFLRDFIERPLEQKIAWIQGQNQIHYIEAQQARQDPVWIGATMREWTERRAWEIKHINSGNKSLYAAYKAASPAQQRTILKEREHQFQLKHKGANYDRADRGTGRLSGPGRGNDGPAGRRAAELGHAAVRGNARAGHDAGRHQSNASQVGRNPPPEARNRLRNVSECGVVRFAQGTQVLLPSHVPGLMGHGGAGANRDVRWAVPGERGERGGQLANAAAGNVASSMYGGALSGIEASRAAAQPDWNNVRLQIDAKELLNRLSHSHRLDLQKYTVEKGGDGGDRIRAGGKIYSPNDFLTKVMKMDWKKEAAPLLKAEFERQGKALGSYQPARQAQQSYWATYRQAHYESVNAQRGQQWAQQKASENERKAALREHYRADKDALRERGRFISPEERKASRSVLAMEKVKAESALRSQIEKEREQLRTAKPIPDQEGYRHWLQGKAQGGDERALAELRRIQDKASPEDKAAALVKDPNPAPAPRDSEPIGAARLDYDVKSNGDVAYLADRREVFRDEGQRVKFSDVGKSRDDHIETGLRLYVQKCGPMVQARGDAEFKANVARVAAERGVYVEFTDKRLNAIMNDRRAAMAKDFRQERQTTRPERERPTAERSHQVTNGDRGQRSYAGELVKHGPAPYNFEKENSGSYYAVLRDKQGQERTVWGVDIKRSLEEARARAGDAVKLTNVGMRTVQVTEVDKKTGETRTIETQRNEWKAEHGDQGRDNEHERDRFREQKEDQERER